MAAIRGFSEKFEAQKHETRLVRRAGVPARPGNIVVSATPIIPEI